jgi:restriction system protein
MLASIHMTLSDWIVGLFISAVKRVGRPQDRLEVINWLADSRAIVASDLPARGKFVALYKGLNARRTVAVAFNSVADAVKNYSKSDLPLGAKLAIPATLLSLPFAAGHAAGIAAFGTAVGVPVLLLIFVGTAGITAIIEACATSEVARDYVQNVMTHVARDEAFRRFRWAMRHGEQGPPEPPVRCEMPPDREGIVGTLLSMDPIAFEKHVMSFFVGNGLTDASMTRRSGDQGIDGMARHEQGLIVVQCKRYAPENKVGRPAIQQFKGAMHDYQAWRGYFFTTSRFTDEAMDSASKTPTLSLIDLDGLVAWQSEPPKFETLN